MMPILFLFLGLLFILIEFYIPGAIMGVIGGVLVVASVIVFANQTESWIAIFLFLFGAITSVILLIKFALWRIVHAKPGFSIYLSKDQEGYQASKYDESLIGKTGIVLSDLKPGGYITVEGKQHQAISISGYIPKGSEVSILSGQEESLIVKSKKS